MALKRPKASSGKLVVLEHASTILKDNPFGDNVPERAARRFSRPSPLCDE